MYQTRTLVVTAYAATVPFALIVFIFNSSQIKYNSCYTRKNPISACTVSAICGIYSFAINIAFYETVSVFFMKLRETFCVYEYRGFCSAAGLIVRSLNMTLGVKFQLLIFFLLNLVSSSICVSEF